MFQATGTAKYRMPMIQGIVSICSLPAATSCLQVTDAVDKQRQRSEISTISGHSQPNRLLSQAECPSPCQANSIKTPKARLLS